ncbi:putative leucine-rich repeat extensin-like protein 4 [Cocos nucifera]|uniref:Putative leucine-rich repeat extensin-like protein 4 n=1 Tax=Cocos nucifera TaxID=13894 RepID=A0A8K0IQZ3_COCNU|nr:putative leucine-rich repeat extensin-like protein 4 [Cocos nucifera]
MATGEYCCFRVKLLVLLISFLHTSSFLHAHSNTSLLDPQRETIETGSGNGTGIGIGDGGGSEAAAPAPSKKPQPSDFPNVKQYNAYIVIQRFKNTITCDPYNVTRTWFGYLPCTYQGFYCDTPPDSPGTPTIASIDFNGFHLCAPTIAGFIDQLPDLALFHANSNNFTGTIPDLTGLKYFYELDVSNNNMSGPFPTDVLPLANLTFLDLRFNLFAGSVPPSIFTLDLDVLFLNNNFFNQFLPANLGSTRVAYLTLANNGFTGPIPRSISYAGSTLLEVLFLNNRLSGCLPYEIGLLSESTVFDAGFNQITGSIPLSFGCLQKVEQLNLAGNLLYGHVPDVVCRLAKTGQLANLSLSGNYFTSIGHSCWELIKSGVLDVRQNCIPGFPDQRRPDECWWFFAHPKHYYCPFYHFIPCKCPVPPATPPTTKAMQRPAAASPPYMAYKALHQRHGK